MCAANATTETDASGAQKFSKRKSTGRIDGMVALVMALARAAADGGEHGSVYDGDDAIGVAVA